MVVNLLLNPFKFGNKRKRTGILLLYIRRVHSGAADLTASRNRGRLIFQRMCMMLIITIWHAGLIPLLQ